MARLVTLSSYLFFAGRKLAPWSCQTLARSVDTDTADQAPSTTRRYKRVYLPWLRPSPVWIPNKCRIAVAPHGFTGWWSGLLRSCGIGSLLVIKNTLSPEESRKRIYAVASCFDPACQCKIQRGFACFCNLYLLHWSCRYSPICHEPRIIGSKIVIACMLTSSPCCLRQFRHVPRSAHHAHSPALPHRDSAIAFGLLVCGLQENSRQPRIGRMQLADRQCTAYADQTTAVQSSQLSVVTAPVDHWCCALPSKTRTVVLIRYSIRT